MYYLHLLSSYKLSLHMANNNKISIIVFWNKGTIDKEGNKIASCELTGIESKITPEKETDSLV